MNLKNAASTGTSVLQKLRHDIVAHIEPVISQYKAVAFKTRGLFFHECFHQPRVDFLCGDPESSFKF